MLEDLFFEKKSQSQNNIIVEQLLWQSTLSSPVGFISEAMSDQVET